MTLAETSHLYPYLRSRDDVKTLGEILPAIEKASPVKYTKCKVSDITIDVAAGTMEAPELEVALGDYGMDVLAGLVQIPSNFLHRLDPELQQQVFDRLLLKEDGEIQLGMADGGLREAVSPQAKVIPIKALLEVAVNVIGEEAEVIDAWAEPTEFRLDVVVPEGHDRFVGGDPQVGDLTQAGLRFTQDRKKNLAPMVTGYFHRLVCTNGMEELDTAFRLKGRATTIEEQLAELESNGRTLMERSVSRMESLYAMRHEVVKKPALYVQRLCLDGGVSPKITTAVVEALADYDEETVTKFDLVNLVTHIARTPKMKTGPSRKLEMIGGELISEHYRRCGSCFHRLDQKA